MCSIPSGHLLAATVIGLILFLCSNLVEPVAIDNEVVGIPQIQCTEQAITFSVRTRNVFRGNIYIKGQYGVPQCRQEYFNNDYAGATFAVRIGECGMRRIRQLQPHGMNYMLVFVANFHPQFMTKVDRAYNVRCFYAQADKTVNSELEVSMINTEALEQATMLMPNCEYSVRAGTVDGPRVRFVRIGDQLVHRWECDNPNYGMLVKNCFVNDGGGVSVRVLDPRGCPIFTPVIQGNLQYDNSLNLAFVPVWAYKFPDRQQMYFQCQIQVCNKRDNECVGISPPNCPLIARPDYIPNSLVNPNVEPTQVIGTFPGGIGPQIAAHLDPRPIAGPVLPTGAIAAGAANLRLPYAAQEKSGDEQFQSQAAQFVDVEFPTSDGMLKNRVSPSSSPQFAASRRMDNTHPDLRNDTADDANHSRPQTHATVDEETLDVVADPVFVADPDLDGDSGNPDMFRSSNDRQADPAAACLNQASVIALCCALALMTTTTISMTVYIFRDLLTNLFRRRSSWQEQFVYGLNNFDDASRSGGGGRQSVIGSIGHPEMLPLPSKERRPSPRYLSGPYVYHPGAE